MGDFRRLVAADRTVVSLHVRMACIVGMRDSSEQRTTVKKTGMSAATMHQSLPLRVK